MIAKLKKLEATENGPAITQDYDMGDDRTSRTPVGRTTPDTASASSPSAELQMLAVPRNGWLSGPGRHFASH